MQQTFEINTNQFSQLYDAVMAKFGNRKVKVVIEDIETNQPVNQKDLYKKTLELRELFKNAVIPPDMNISDLANEMLGE